MKLAAAQEELAQWPKWCAIEVMIRNPQVAEVVTHWEERAERAERENADLRQQLDASCNAEELRQVREENAALRELVDEIISCHADPESPWFNDCNQNRECQWCVEAKAARTGEKHD